MTRLVFVPSAEAAIALGRGAPAEAIAALATAGPAEFGTVAGLAPTLLRGDAYLAAGDARWPAPSISGARSSRHRSVAPMIPLAHLGLRAPGRRSVTWRRDPRDDELLAIWKDADPDLPVLLRARAEHDRLTSRDSSAPAAR